MAIHEMFPHNVAANTNIYLFIYTNEIYRCVYFLDMSEYLMSQFGTQV